MDLASIYLFISDGADLDDRHVMISCRFSLRCSRRLLLTLTVS